MRESVGISEVFGNSFTVLRNNPRIVWPLLLFTLFITGVSLSALSLILPAGTLLHSYNNPFSALNMNTGGQYNTTSPMFSPSQILTFLPGFIGALGLIIIVALFVGLPMQGFYIAIAEQGYKKQKISMSAAFDVAKARYLSLLGAAVLYFIIVFVIAIVFILVFAVLFILPGHLVHILGALLLLLIGVVLVFLLGISFYQLYTVVILEKRDPVDAIKRSMDIGRKLWGEILAVIIISTIISSVIGIIGSLIGIALGIIVGYAGGAVAGLVIQQFVNIVITVSFSTWLILVPVFFYHEYVTSGTKKMKK
jgi:hypothetical protein